MRCRPTHVLTGILLLAFQCGTLETVGAQVVINEVLASSRVAHLDEDGDSSDWIELYNAGAAPVDLEGWTLTDDVRRVTKWTLPRLVLQPGEFLLVWCSAKDRYQAPHEAVFRVGATVPIDPIFAAFDSEWSWLVGQPSDGAPPFGWNRPGFDDGEWQRGMPGFGFGDDDDRTLLPEGVGAVFLRLEFDAQESLRDLDRLLLEVDFDDGFVAYLNGVRVASAGFPDDVEPDFSSLASSSHEAGVPLRYGLEDYRHLLRPRGNVLAFALLNRQTTSADLSLVPILGRVEPILHTSFRIDAAGETLLLADAERNVVDGLVLPVQSTDHSFGRVPDGAVDIDGAPALAYFPFPSPGGPNGPESTTRLVPEEVAFSPVGGRLATGAAVDLSLDVDLPGLDLRYTLNGDPPNSESALWETPLQILQDTVVRAAGFLGERLVVPSVSQSYFVESRDVRLPVLSISMAPVEFEQMQLDQTARGRRSERAAFLEIFDASVRRELGTGIGLRLHGGAGRAGDFGTKKSYRAYFRREYGDSALEYPLFRDVPVSTYITHFERLVLRANFNDAFRTGSEAALIRDQVARDLFAGMGQLVARGTWYHLFVDMQYRGLYNVVERIDARFFASHASHLGSEWDVIKSGNNVQDGDALAWNDFRRFVREGDFGDPAELAELAGRIDLDNFADYMVMQLWSQNEDWPQNNWYAARARRPGARWRFLCWDMEHAMGRFPRGAGEDTFAHVLGRPQAAAAGVFIALLASRNWQNEFLDRFEERLDSTLSTESVLEHIEAQVAAVSPGIQEELRFVGATREIWMANLETMREFARSRPDALRRLVYAHDELNVPRILSVRPDRVVLGADPVRVTLEGKGLAGVERVVVGGVELDELTVSSDTEVGLLLRRGPAWSGPQTVRVLDPAGFGVARRGALVIETVEERFRRGDCNGDERSNLADAVCILEALFRGTGSNECLDSLDVDDSGHVNLTDAVRLVDWIFGAGPAPPAPVGDCGPDPSADSLDCEGGC